MDRGLNHRLLDVLDLGGGGQRGWALDLLRLAIRLHHAVAHGRRSRDEIQAVLPLKTLLDDLRVQEAQEATAKPEPESRARFRLVADRGVVQPELFEGPLECLIVLGIHRIKSGEDHGLDFAEARQRLGGGTAGLGDRVADANVGEGFHAGDHDAHLPDGERVDLARVRIDHVKFCDIVLIAHGHETNPHPLVQCAVDDANQQCNTHIGVEPGVKDEGAYRCLRIPDGCRHFLHDALQKLGDPRSLFGGDAQHVLRREPDHFFDLVRDAFRIRCRQIDLVEHRDDLEIRVHGEVRIGEGLRLDALGGVHDEDRTLTGVQGP